MRPHWLPVAAALGAASSLLTACEAALLGLAVGVFVSHVDEVWERRRAALELKEQARQRARAAIRHRKRRRLHPRLQLMDKAPATSRAARIAGVCNGEVVFDNVAYACLALD